VTTDVGAVREVIDAEVGLVVPPLDDVALADAIAALGGDPARRARLGAAGRARIERDHGLEACAAGHLRAYELALGHAAGRRRR
jgi:glycosyltransferase involved in cell wall biosynthesis